MWLRRHHRIERLWRLKNLNRYNPPPRLDRCKETWGHGPTLKRTQTPSISMLNLYMDGPGQRARRTVQQSSHQSKCSVIWSTDSHIRFVFKCTSCGRCLICITLQVFWKDMHIHIHNMIHSDTFRKCGHAFAFFFASWDKIVFSLHQTVFLRAKYLCRLNFLISEQKTLGSI